jgi:hypothetical protein
MTCMAIICFFLSNNVPDRRVPSVENNQIKQFNTTGVYAMKRRWAAWYLCASDRLFRLDVLVPGRLP